MAVESIRDRENIKDEVDKCENDSDKMNFDDEILDLTIHKEREETIGGAEDKYVDDSPLENCKEAGGSGTEREKI